jgi:hypothetical protein
LIEIGYSGGWFGDVPIAAAVEAKLAPFNIGLRGAVWVHVPGGTTWLVRAAAETTGYGAVPPGVPGTCRARARSSAPSAG